MVSRGTVLPAKILSHFFSIFVYMDSFRWADKARHSSCRFPHCSFSSRSSLYVSRAWCCSHRIINCTGGSFCLLTFKFPNWSSVRFNVSCTFEAMSRRLMSFMVESSWLISVSTIRDSSRSRRRQMANQQCFDFQLDGPNQSHYLSLFSDDRP